MSETIFVVAYGTITFLAGVILGYGLGYRRRPYTPRPIAPTVIAARLQPTGTKED